MLESYNKKKSFYSKRNKAKNKVKTENLAFFNIFTSALALADWLYFCLIVMGLINLILINFNINKIILIEKKNAISLLQYFL